MESNQTPGGMAGMPVPGAPGQTQQMTPQQKKLFAEIVQQGTKFLTDQQTSEDLVRRAMQGDAKQVVAHAVTTLIMQQFHAAAGAGVQLDPLTLVSAGLMLVTIVARQLVAARVITEQQLPAFVGATAKLAADQHNASAAAGGQQQPAPPQPGAAPQPQGGV